MKIEAKQEYSLSISGSLAGPSISGTKTQKEGQYIVYNIDICQKKIVNNKWTMILYDSCFNCAI